MRFKSLLLNLRSNFKIVAFAVVIWAGCVSGAMYLVESANQSFVRQHEKLVEQSSNYAHLIAEHDTYGFDVANILLQDMEDNIELLGWQGGPVSPKQKEALHSLLIEHRNRLPGIASFSIIDAEGMRITGIVGKDNTDLSERPYFKGIKNEGKEFFISNVEQGMASGKDGIHIARRLQNKKGEFIGVIVINLAADDMFFQYYKQLKLGEGTITSLEDNKRVLISYPRLTEEQSQQTLQNFVNETLSEGAQAGTAEYEPVNGPKKIVAYERLRGTNFYSVVVVPDLIPNIENSIFSWPYLSAAAVLLAAILGTTILFNAHRLSEAHREVLESANERKRLIKKLNTVAEDERKSIAIEIHDVMNATLLSSKVDAVSIKRETADATDPELRRINERAAAIEKNAKAMYQFCRNLVARLRPEVLDISGFGEAVTEIVNDFNSRFPQSYCELKTTGDLNSLDKDIAIGAYRVIQESMSNIQKHAHATNINIDIVVDSAAHILTIDIVDDGVGFADGKLTGFGLLGMRERIRALGGEYRIESTPDVGTRTTVNVPLDQA